MKFVFRQAQNPAGNRTARIDFLEEIGILAMIDVPDHRESFGFRRGRFDRGLPATGTRQSARSETGPT